MNYSKIYDDLVAKCVIRGLDKSILEGYFEKHHILPKCLGGNDLKENLVLFTGREHFIAHVLLTKIYPKHNGLKFALYRMITDKTPRGYNVSSRTYSKAQEMLSVINSGDSNPAKTETSKVKMSEAKLGVLQTANTSGYVGVLWDKSKNKWIAQVFKRISGKAINKKLGQFESKEDAIAARLNWENSVDRDSIFQTA